MRVAADTQDPRLETWHSQLVGSGRLPSSGRALVPGCGRGYDVALLASRDLRVTGLELIADAASTARSYVSHHAPEKAGFWDVQNGDFFQHTPSEPYDLVYDHTFLCALFPSARPKWASRMAELLRSGGVLVTQMWPLQPDDLLDLTEGPPFSLSKRVYAALLEPAGFSLELLEDIPPKDMIPGRRGVEAIGVWRRL